MSEQSHAPEPWAYRMDALTSMGHIRDGRRRCIVQVWDFPESEANAARIVACVNALAGIADPVAAVPAMVTALASMTDAWEAYLRNPDNIGVDIEGEIDDARAALALARPQE